MFSGLESPTKILMILLVAVLLFGVKRLPEIGRSLGTGMREFKESISGDTAPPSLETPADEAATSEPAGPTR